MVPPLLKLSIVQGPIEGESREYKPGSTIRIGRVARGNEITIKDGGISTKHLKIVSDSENWIIQDLGSSNGTTVNLKDLDPDTPLNLGNGDVIRLGADTIIQVSFVVVDDVVKPPESSKLPPRPRRNNRRLAVSDPDPDPEVPKRTMRSKADDEEKESKVVSRVGRPRKVAITKEDEKDEAPVEKKGNPRARRGKKNAESDESVIESVHEEVSKRTRGCRSRIIDDIADIEKESEVVTRVTRSRKNEKKVVIGKVEEEEAPVEKMGNSRARRGQNSENLGLNLVKLEVEDTPKGVEIPAVKRATRSKKIELQSVKSEDIAFEEKDEQRITRATRSKRKEIGGDSYMELDMILNQARKSRAKKKKTEQEPPESVEIEARNDEDVEEYKEIDKDNEDQIGCSGKSEENCDKEDAISENVEQVETEAEKREDIEAEKLKEMRLLEEECHDAEPERKSKEAGSETSEKVEQKLSENEKVDGGNDDVEEDMVKEKDSEGCTERSNEEYEISELVETVVEKSSTVGEDGEAEKLQDLSLPEEECRDSERDCKSEEKLCENIETEGKNADDVEEGKEKEDQGVCSDDKCDTEDDISQRVEQVEIELKKSSTIGEDGEIEKLQDMGLLEAECRKSEKDYKSEEKPFATVEMEARSDDDGAEGDKENGDQKSRSDEDVISTKVEQVEIELAKSSVGEHGETERCITEDECRDSERDPKSEEKQSESEEEAKNDDDVKEDKANEHQKLESIEMKAGIVGIEEDIVKEKDNEGYNERSETEDEISERIELQKSGTIGEDEETEKVQDIGLPEEECLVSESGCKSEEVGLETSEKVEEERSSNKKVDLKNMTLGEWFAHLEVDLRAQIIEETEKMIEPMRSKSLRVQQHIREQKKALGKKGL